MGGNEVLDDVKEIFQRVEDALCKLNQLDINSSIKKDIYLIRLTLMNELIELEKKHL